MKNYIDYKSIEVLKIITEKKEIINEKFDSRSSFTKDL
jgi:hypothetical protein